ncbi:undecaprenyl-diphosphate phosphatase [Kitasatospora sp. NPDC097691]|uniref:undecaprenyl-diphosphate phosphatase n=1 Tax=Kitasatospora sp. NPDC097691 TaxID=3157231 RepID=UPI0033191243
MSFLTYPEAVGVGLLNGVTELFPVSSLGHSILLPALIGGRWRHDLDVSAPGSPYLAVLVGLRLATTLALVLRFRHDWARIARGLCSSVRRRMIRDPDQRLAWLVIAGAAPVGAAGLAISGVFKAVLGKPVPAAVFLTVNGLMLFGVEVLRRDGSGRRRAQPYVAPGDRHLSAEGQSDRRIVQLSYRQAICIGAAQITAFLPGISRTGITIGAGVLNGLSHEDSARFAFLLTAPVIGSAALFELPALIDARGADLGAQLPIASALAFVGGYAAVHFLSRYFRTHTLKPFAWYCSLAGLGGLVYLTV